jgi:hypothetical protein
MQLKIETLAREKAALAEMIGNLQEKLWVLGLGDREYDLRKEIQLKELREQIELRR